ncbi:MAG: M15 family metallopeptidase [Ahrensia sp.]|nr:M15 family metallopeptidase [Ahrensia sp.]
MEEMMFLDRQLQAALKAAEFYSGPIDGVFGADSWNAADQALRSIGVDADNWPLSRTRVAWEQWAMKSVGIEVGNADGLISPSTLFAYEQWQNYQRDFTPTTEEIAHLKRIWPRQADMRDFYGKPGSGHVQLDLPYPMRCAWNKSHIIESINIHGKCAQSAGLIFGRVLEYYGYERIRQLGLDLIGDCYANRAMRGGKALSTHAYACAIDINPGANKLRWGQDRAAMASIDCEMFVKAFEDEGWISIGRERNYDWMHFQAARF